MMSKSSLIRDRIFYEFLDRLGAFMTRTVYLHSPPEIPIDGDRLTVITPTRQIARSLQVPHLNLETLAQQICQRQGQTIAPVLLARRTLQTAVKIALSPTDIEGTARSFSGAVKSILRAGIDLETLASVSQPKVRQLAHLTRTYQQQLAEYRAIEPSELFWHASRFMKGQKGDRQPLFIYGYFQPRRDRLAFIDAIAAEGSAIVLPCQDEDIFTDNRQAIDWLQKREWEIIDNPPSHPLPSNIPISASPRPRVPASLHPPSPHLQSHTYPNLEAEVRGVLTQVKQLLTDGVAARDIVLVARDDTLYGPTVLDVAWEYELPMRALYPVPLAATRLGAWIRLLLEVIGSNFPFEATAKLLSHPLVGGKLKAVWPDVRSRHPQGLRSWRTLGKQAGLDLSVLKWKKKDTRSNWGQRLREVFEGFHIRQQCGGWAREIVAYYKFLEGLEALGQPETERVAFADFTRDVTDSLRLLSVPAQPGRGGVELHVPQSVAGTRYPHVFVLGMAEGIFPAPLQDDPVLDFFTRKQLQRQEFPIESIAQIARREALGFRFLQSVAAQTLIFSYPQRMGKAEMLPSPYLSGLGLNSQVLELASASLEEVRKVELARYVANGNAPKNGKNGKVDPLFSHIVAAWQIERHRESADPQDEYDGAISVGIDPTKRVFSASQLTQLGQCGFKWFAGHLLHLDELDEAQTELEGRMRGRLYHKTLELALHMAREKPDLDLQDGMLECLEAAFEEAEETERVGDVSAWEVRRREHLDRLRRTIAHESFLSEDAEVLATERTFVGTWHGLKVEGTVDRIDETPEGLQLVEYKNISSKPTAAKDRDGKAKLEVQLPLYAQVAAKVLFPDRPVAKAYYYSITKQKTFEVKADDGELAKFIDRVKDQLSQGNYRVEPDVDGKACNYCAQDLVCRKGARLDRKQRSGQMEDAS
ncbi:MAG: PD-(D/E)XK nuclease family protein [Cyanobacteriota bacterium]|nr:PD-(D/E)XK nuclease family protein [Cyanobacteriota bacterium]